jgi:hypothetical protein
MGSSSKCSRLKLTVVRKNQSRSTDISVFARDDLPVWRSALALVAGAHMSINSSIGRNLGARKLAKCLRDCSSLW